MVEVSRKRSSDVLRNLFFFFFFSKEKVLLLFCMGNSILVVYTNFEKYLSKQMVALATPLPPLTN
jgi:hypothetical protein